MVMYLFSTENDNYISVKKIILFLFLYSIILVMGKYLKDGVGIASFFVFIIFIIARKYNLVIYFLIIWLFLSNYFIGQGYIKQTTIYNYLFNGNLYVIILFFVTFKIKWLNTMINLKLLKWVVLILLLIFISNTLHFSFKPSFIYHTNNILLFLIIFNVSLSNKFNQNVILILISLGIFEVIISYFQVFEILPPPITQMKDIIGRRFIWEAGLDDVASGTFGASASNVTSWFETVLFFFFFSYGILNRKNIFILLSFIFIAQYGSIDSKTALGVTVISFLIMLWRIRSIYNLNYKNIISALLLVLFVVFLTNTIKSYYNKNFKKGTVGVNIQLSDSYNAISKNITDWGKIAGFKYITYDWFKSGEPLNLFIGYGSGNFEYSNNSGKIENMDTPLMQMNNITRSRSALIHMYGNYGVLGLLLLFWLFIILWNDLSSRKFTSLIGKGFKISGITILSGSIIFMFLYGGHDYRDLAFQCFLIIYAIVLKTEKEMKLKYND
jgi:hypothetical protein